MISLAYAALWMFVFSVPWENVVAIPGVGAISRLFGMIGLGLAVLAALTSGRVRRWHLFHVAALLFVIWSGSSILIFELGVVPKKFWTYTQLFLVLWMIWELAPSAQRQRGLLTAYVFGAYISAFSTITASRRLSGMARRFAAAGFDANDLAAALVLALPMAWYVGTTTRHPLLRWVCRAYIPVGLVAIGLTGSRGGMLATIVALTVIPLTMTRLSPGRLAIAIAVLCISGSLAVAFVPETVVQRLATTKGDVEEGRLGGRFKIWVAGAHAFAKQPLLGYGTSGFKTAITPFLPTTPQVAHNTFLSILVEQGLLGFSLYILMIVSVLRAILGVPQKLERRFGLVLLATLMVVMLPLSWEDRKPVWFVLAALFGLAAALGSRARPRVPWQAYQGQAGPGAGRSNRQPRPQPLAAVPQKRDRDATA